MLLINILKYVADMELLTVLLYHVTNKDVIRYFIEQASNDAKPVSLMASCPYC